MLPKTLAFNRCMPIEKIDAMKYALSINNNVKAARKI